MKLHLPKALFTALLAACAAQTSWGVTTYDLLQETTGWTLRSKDGVDKTSAPGFATGDSGRYIDMTKSGVWKQDLATYELSRYTVIGGDEIAFNVSYNLPGSVNDAVLSMGFVGLDQSLIIGTLGYRTDGSGGTKIGYGTSSDTWSDIHLGTNANGGPTADWVGITEAVVNNFQAFNGVTRKAGEYSWSGTVTLSNGSYLLNLYMTEPGGTEAVQCLTNVNLGSSFDINRMYFSYDGNETNTYLTEFSVTGTKTERPIYSTVLSTATQNAESGTWSSAGQGIGYVDMKVTDGNSVLEIGSTAENGSSMTLAEGTNVYAAGATQGTVTLNSSQPVTIRRIFADSGATLNMNAALNAGALLTIDGPGTVKLIADQSLSSLNVNNTVAEIAEGTTIEISGRDTSFLSSISGKGKVRFTGSENLYLAGAANTNTYTTTPKKWTIGFTGTIAMSAATKLILGSDVSGSYNHVGWAVDLSSTTLEINGGGIHFNGHYSTIGTLDVNASDTLHIEDTLGPNNPSTITAGLTINTLNLDADLKLTKNWKSRVDIGVLQGSGNLNIVESSNNEAWIINLGSISGGGDISVGVKATLNISGEMSGSTSITGAGTVNIAETATVSGTMSFADIRLNHTLQNTGSVTLDGNVYASTLDNYASGVVDGMEMTYSDGENGYITSGAYFLVQSQGEGQVAVSEGKKLYIGDTAIGTIAKDTATNSLYVGYVNENVNSGIYYINTTDFTVDGAADNKAVNATKYVVAEGRTLTISAAQNGTMTAAKILTGTEGDGNVIVDTDITLSSGVATHVTGKLTINSGKTLTIGAGSLDESTIASFAGGVELAGGTLSFNGKGQEMSSLKVTKAGSLNMSNVGRAHQTFTINGITTLEDDLTVGSAVDMEHGTLRIKELTGSGDIFVSGGSNNKGWGEISMKVDKLTDYTGMISVDGEGHTQNINYVEFGSAAGAGFQTLKGLTVSNKAYSAVYGKGDTTIENLTLANGGVHKYHTYGTGSGNDGYSHSISKLTIDGSGTITTTNSAGGWQAEISIGELKNAEGSTSGELYITSGNVTSQRSIINLDGGDFAGLINVTASSTDSNRKLALNINSEDAAADAEIKLNGNGAKVALGVGYDTVNVKGISDAANASGTMSIVSGKQAYNTDAEFSSDDTVRTLAINTAGGNYSTSATVAKNLNIEKQGEGSQTFSGTVSSFNGSISALAGELAFTAADALSVSSLNVSNVGTLTVEKDSTRGTVTTSNATLAGGATVNANLTLSVGATLQMNGVTQDSAVALDGVLTLEKSGDSLITLTGTVLDTLEGLQAPGSGEVVLFTGVDSLVLGGQPYTVGSETLNTGSNVKLSDYFRNDCDIDFDKYYLAFNDSTGNLTAGLIIPEPTTATLSLLALAGLCARRRRK